MRLPKTSSHVASDVWPITRDHGPDGLKAFPEAIPVVERHRDAFCLPGRKGPRQGDISLEGSSILGRELQKVLGLPSHRTHWIWARLQPLFPSPGASRPLSWLHGPCAMPLREASFRPSLED